MENLFLQFLIQEDSRFFKYFISSCIHENGTPCATNHRKRSIWIILPGIESPEMILTIPKADDYDDHFDYLLGEIFC